MTVIDVALLALVGAWTLWTFLRLRASRPIALFVFGAAIVLIATQLAVEGFHWQFLPLYGLVTLCLLILVPWSAAISRLHWPGRFAVRLLLVLALGILALCWIVLPVALAEGTQAGAASSTSQQSMPIPT